MALATPPTRYDNRTIHEHVSALMVTHAFIVARTAPLRSNFEQGM
jgi:hypothetical protein